MIADMHTHSESSHDSVCKIEDMYNSQIRNGTEIFAVTDHFDTASFMDYDVFTPIEKAYNAVLELNKRHQDKCLVLSGIEISEGFWYPEICKKAVNMLSYDVIIGSVHLVKYKELTYAYSGIDFSCLSRETIVEYMDAYFNDMLTMADTLDFDVLAHLTCPIRYINGKYKKNLNLSLFEEKITEILKRIIQRNIALEVNTSSFDVLNDFLPSCEILKKYRKLGGHLITLGSDAHTAEHASRHFDVAIGALKNIGFENICYYKNRNAHKIEI